MPATFPTLKTGSFIQYPATKITGYSSVIVRFLDGSDQRYRQLTPPLRRWVIQLDMLDEAELATLDQFFIAEEGRFGMFAFVDPWTQTNFPNCSLDQEALGYQLTEESRGTTHLVIVENRA